MRFSGKIYKDGRFWLAEIPILDAMTQGHTQKEAIEMAADMVETMANKEGFRVEVALVSGNKARKGVTSRNGMGLANRRYHALSGLIRTCYAIQSIFILN